MERTRCHHRSGPRPGTPSKPLASLIPCGAFSPGAGAAWRVERALEWGGVGTLLGRCSATQWIQPELTQLPQQQKPFSPAHKMQTSPPSPGRTGRQRGRVEAQARGATGNSAGWGPKDTGLLTCVDLVGRDTGGGGGHLTGAPESPELPPGLWVGLLSRPGALAPFRKVPPKTCPALCRTRGDRQHRARPLATSGSQKYPAVPRMGCGRTPRQR